MRNKLCVQCLLLASFFVMGLSLNAYGKEFNKIEKQVENHLIQLRENKKSWGINFSIFKDRQDLMHYRIGVFNDKKSFEKDSINKAEYDYFKNYGVKLIEKMRPDQNSSACDAPVQYVINQSKKSCFFLDSETKNEFMEWFNSVEQFVMGKEERDNNLLKRLLKPKTEN